ncbi:DNA polymerase [Nitrosopumilus sp.]|uniref:DNA polymerase n=1 Tax=Nitrosopumilus sp. TaxID=2024843 RepID=UPI00349FD26D
MADSIGITDYKDLSKLYTGRTQNRDLAQTYLHDIHGVDTETWNGDIFLIADSDGRYLDKITPNSVINFLFSKKFENAWNFFYNIEYDAGVILKLLGNRLNIFKTTKNLHFTYNDYTLDYIPKKRLRVSKGHHSRIFFDIAQFYQSSLVDAYQKNIRKLDEQYLAMKDKRDQFSPTYYRRHTNKVRQYCIDDCIMTKELSQHWVKIFHDAFLFYPKRWISSGYLAEKVLFNHGIDIPKFNSIPYPIQDLAYRSSFGGRFEILKRGFIGKAYLYDINSAYPNAFSNIPDLNNGKWLHRKSVHQDAKIGFFRILADIPDEKYIPAFPFKANGTVLFPSGKFETYVTLPELLACEKKWYKILDSFQFIPKTNHLPYREFIENLYEKRMTLKKQNNPMQLPLKIILNAIYGKTGANTNRISGNIFIPVIFSHITGYTRAQLYNMVKEHGIERDVVFFATDSICSTRKLDIDSTKLGEFSFDNEADDVEVLQNGIYRFNSWKKRGLGKLNGKDIEHLDTFEKDGKLFIKYLEKRNTTLKMAIIQNKISDIGKIKPKVKEININADRKRQWVEKLTGINDGSFNDSMPLSLNWISKDNI